MTDDQGILIFMAAGVAALAIIIVIGVLSSRRKRNSGTATWTVGLQYLGEQPYLASSDVLLNDKHEWEMFQSRYAVGTAVPIADGPTLHVSSVKQSLRAGWPIAKAGFTAYFAEYAHSEFPAVFLVKGSNGITVLDLDDSGVTAVDGTDRAVWSSTWRALTFSNGPDLILRNEKEAIHVESNEPLEELLIKYGTLKQMHF